MFYEVISEHTWVIWGGAARLLTLTLPTVYADFFAAKIDLKFQPKITSKNILASKKKKFWVNLVMFPTLFMSWLAHGPSKNWLRNLVQALRILCFLTNLKPSYLQN